MAGPYHAVSGAPTPSPRQTVYFENESNYLQNSMYDTERQSEDYLNMLPLPTPRSVRFQKPTGDAISDPEPYISTGRSRAGLGIGRGVPNYLQPPSHTISSPYDNSIYNDRPYLPVDAIYPSSPYHSLPYYWPPAPSIPDQTVFETRPQHPVAMDSAPTYYQTDEDYDIASNAPQDEESAVHHVIKINFPQSNHVNDEIIYPKARTRAFTDQPIFVHKSEVHKVEYDIVQTQLRTASNDLDHAIALLAYEEKSSKDDTPRPKPETRWIHFQTDSMSLELFKMEVLRLNLIPDDTTALLMPLFKRLQQHHEGSSVHGKHLEPTAMDFVGQGEDGKVKKCAVAFVAFPYLMLDSPHLGNDHLSTPLVHPVRSLFQFHYLFDSTEMRDKDQIVRSARETEDILHVPQIWMLWINEGMPADIIFSMASTDINSLQRDYIAFEKLPPLASVATQAQIRMIDPEDNQYSLSLPQCGTWFEFIGLFTGALESTSAMRQSFLNDTWKEIYELRLNDKELVSETNWSEIVHSQEKSNIITIRILLKPSVSLKDHQTLLPHETSQDFRPPGEGYPPNSGSLIRHSDPYRDLSMFSQRPAGNRITRIKPSLNESLLSSHTPGQTVEMNASYSQVGMQPSERGPHSRRSLRPHMEHPPLSRNFESTQRVVYNKRRRFSPSIGPSYPPRSPKAGPPSNSFSASEAPYNARIEFTRYYPTPQHQFTEKEPLYPVNYMDSYTEVPHRSIKKDDSTGRTQNEGIRIASEQLEPPGGAYSCSLRSSSSDQSSTQTVIPDPTGREERHLHENAQQPSSNARVAAPDERTSKRSTSATDLVVEMEFNLHNGLSTVPEKEPPGASVSKTHSPVSPSASISHLNSLPQKDASNDAPIIPRHPTTSLQSYVEDADDDDYIPSINKPSIVTSEIQRHSSMEDLKKDVSDNEAKADSATRIGNDDTKPMRYSNSSIGSNICSASSNSSEVKIGEPNDQNISSNNAISTSDSSLHNELVPKNPRLVAPAAIKVYDYMVPRFDDEPMTTIKNASEGMNPFAYQDYNDAWETTENVEATTVQPETSPFCPIFAWKPETVDGITQNPPETNALVPQQWKDMDRIIHAILQERDADAKVFLFENNLENSFVSVLAESSRNEVFEQLGIIESIITQFEELDIQAEERLKWLTKKAVIASAIEIFDSFLPLHYQKLDQYWVTRKFWGAVLRIAVSEFSNSYLDNVGNDLSHFYKCIRQIHNGVSYDKRKETSTYYLPKALVNVFNPLVFYLCVCSQLDRTDCPGWNALQVRAVSINESLLIGRHQLISMIHAGDFTGAKVFRRVDSQAIITFVIGGMIKPCSSACSPEGSDEEFNLLQTYRQYLSDLRHEVRREPRAETFDRIQQMREELSIVSIVLDQQMKVLKQMRLVWSNIQNPANQISTQSIYQTRRQIRQLKRDLGELEILAGKTSILLRSSIEVRKESNSQAIVVFTIVTVVFLPLSFITSYFGMNSVDIRDGTFDQSLFWIVALPITSFLLLLLWALIELRRRMRASGKRFGGRLPTARGVRRLCKLPLQKIALLFNATMDALSGNQASR